MTPTPQSTSAMDDIMSADLHEPQTSSACKCEMHRAAAPICTNFQEISPMVTGCMGCLHRHACHATPSTAAEPIDERKAFEAAFPGLPEQLEYNPVSERYLDIHTHAAWYGWQMRAAQSREQGK
jgi:hypothetical protein